MLYEVITGWVVVLAFKPLIDSLSATNSMEVLWWLIAGGLFYTVGAVLYQFKKIPYLHAIFHLFVLGGSICHFVAIWKIQLVITSYSIHYTKLYDAE